MPLNSSPGRIKVCIFLVAIKSCVIKSNDKK
jgi:hypothetical protein